jgi:dimethylargininase
MSFTRAVVRPPGENFAGGLTTAGLGPPDLARAVEQHARYVEALSLCGLSVTSLPPDARFPDGCFVEDPAIVTPAGAVIARPGAESRRGETESIRAALSSLVPVVGTIEPPGTLDGGDVLEIEGRYAIGVSRRTDGEGARQLAAILGKLGFPATTIDLAGLPGLLHLKSGAASLGDGRVAAVAGLALHPAFRPFEIVPVGDDEAYAANCIRVNEHVLLPRGFARLEAELRSSGYRTIVLDMSEFRKMDGGLSCLSLRF